MDPLKERDLHSPNFLQIQLSVGDGTRVLEDERLTSRAGDPSGQVFGLFGEFGVCA